MKKLLRKSKRSETVKKKHSTMPRLLIKNSKRSLKRSMMTMPTAMRHAQHTQINRKKRVLVLVTMTRLGKKSLIRLKALGMLLRRREPTKRQVLKRKKEKLHGLMLKLNTKQDKRSRNCCRTNSQNMLTKRSLHNPTTNGRLLIKVTARAKKD